MRTVDVCRLTGLSFRELDYAVRRGWASAEGGVGSGHGREFTRSEALIAYCARRLIADGFRPPEAWNLARRLQASTDVIELAGGLIATTGKRFVWPSETTSEKASA